MKPVIAIAFACASVSVLYLPASVDQPSNESTTESIQRNLRSTQSLAKPVFRPVVCLE